jgi:3-oxoacyl-[acyl-carrier protein] reductase
MTERWILVTGSAKHLGKAIALRLAKEKFSIIVHYRKSEREAQATATECRALGVRAITMAGDLSTVEGAAALAQETKKAVPTLYGLVNNVGFYFWGTALRSPMQDAQEIFTVNFFSPLTLIQELAPQICDSQGMIVNIGTIGLYSGRADVHAPFYAASKQAILFLTRSLAKELAPRRVRVNMVSPGVMTHSVDLADYADVLPFKRAATPEEVAEAVAFLVGEEYVTGQNIEVAGGFGL